MEWRRNFFAALGALLSSLVGGCADDICTNRIIQRIANPNSDTIGYVFTRDCGATTGIATNVAIGRKGEDPAQAEIVFTADADHGSALQEENGAIWLRGSWTAPGILSLAYAEHSRLFRTKTSAKGATIRYRASGPLPLPPVP